MRKIVCVCVWGGGGHTERDREMERKCIMGHVNRTAFQ